MPFSIKRMSVTVALLAILSAGGPAAAAVQAPAASQVVGINRPLGLPFNTAPGPSTWVIGQQYGNTSGAYNWGKYWYGAGQGLHFGIDFTTPCQTPIVAVADGVVDFTDNFSHGSAPHNLAIRHQDLGLISFYGHLYRRPTVQRGQPVKRGEVVALSGDPDSTCISRPHLHLEIRSLNYQIAYNPAALIDADWAGLSAIGYSGRFVKDLYHPDRWQTIDDQPNVRFGDRILNGYDAAWPPKVRYHAPQQTAAALTAAPLQLQAALQFQRLTTPGCCSMAWWGADNQSVRYFDGPDGAFASTFSILVTGGVPSVIDPVTPVSTSLNGNYVLRWRGDRAEIEEVTTGKRFQIATSGTWPSFSPSARRLLWQRFPADPVPGNAPPLTEVWVSDVDGTNRRIVSIQPGGSVYWLDDDRLLLAAKEGQTLFTRLSIYDLRTNTNLPLFRAENLRGISIAPGGAHVTFYLTFQKDPAFDGVFVLESAVGAQPVKLPFFGSWRWRDSTTLLYIPYNPGSAMALFDYNIATSQSRALTDPTQQPFKILNDEWSISPDGSKVLYWDESDRALWLITLPT
jgi:murein DD-endopeptidase MepM/ murein hydrolase activator NlpD